MKTFREKRLALRKITQEFAGADEVPLDLADWVLDMADEIYRQREEKKDAPDPDPSAGFEGIEADRPETPEEERWYDEGIKTGALAERIRTVRDCLERFDSEIGDVLISEPRVSRVRQAISDVRYEGGNAP